jgi:hypothetical protein
MLTSTRCSTLFSSVFLIAAVLAAAAEKAPPDPRLLQPITMTVSGERLHTVLERIESSTGVTIQCGKDASDWHVRDIPVLVCAQGLALGELLEAIAHSTHLKLVSEQQGGKHVYRIWRDTAMEKELADYWGTCRRDAIAKMKWDWDTCAACKVVPESACNAYYHGMEKQFPQILSVLGTKARDLILAGNPMCLSVGKAPASLDQVLTDIFRTRDEICRPGDNNGPKVLSDKELQQCFMRISVIDAQMPRIEIYICTPGACMSYYLGGLTDALLRSDPSTPAPHKGTNDTRNVGTFESDYSTRGILSKEFRTDKVEGASIAMRADLLCALSKQTGVSIICEDYGHDSRGSQMGKERPTVYDVLCYNSSYLVWSLDEASRCVVGHDRAWRYHLANLVPEAFVKDFATKANTCGVTFDDMASVCQFTGDQQSEWITQSKEIGITSWQWSGTLMKLYSSLSPHDKELTWTSGGCPLTNAGEDILIETWLETMPTEAMMCDCESMVITGSRRKALSDELRRTASLRGFKSNRRSTEQDEVSLDLMVSTNGHLETRSMWLDQAFPVYSRARTLELQKEHQTTAK